MFCVCALLRKQWVERERLGFPLLQLPMEMVRSDSAGGVGVPALFKNPVTWIGVAVPVGIHLMNYLHTFFPGLPSDM